MTDTPKNPFMGTLKGLMDDILMAHAPTYQKVKDLFQETYAAAYEAGKAEGAKGTYTERDLRNARREGFVNGCATLKIHFYNQDRYATGDAIDNAFGWTEMARQEYPDPVKPRVVTVGCGNVGYRIVDGYLQTDQGVGIWVLSSFSVEELVELGTLVENPTEPDEELMKRTPLKRGKPLKRSDKPMKKRGETKRKKDKRYSDYMKSPAWQAKRKAALERAGHRCEYVEYESYGASRRRITRCPETRGLQVHHRTNVRFGGKELPEDLKVLCTHHHQTLEMSLYPHRAAMRRMR